MTLPEAIEEMSELMGVISMMTGRLQLLQKQLTAERPPPGPSKDFDCELELNRVLALLRIERSEHAKLRARANARGNE